VGDVNAKVTATAISDSSKSASSAIAVHGVSVVATCLWSLPAGRQA
jgi:hypothetical protein